MKKMPTRQVLALLSALSLGTGSLWAQAAPGAETAPAPEEKQGETIVLSPFVVEATEDEGYLASATLAGSRVRTDLRDIASSISVVTAQFLRDTKATNNQTLLQYTTNTEVGGVYGNFAGVGSTFIEGAGENNLARPNTNTRVRGLDSADNTRDFFLTDLPWDSYNVGRVDLQRGPNSILYGVGSPAGIINASVNSAGFKSGGQIENRVSSFGSVRNSADYNYVVIPRTLAVRFSALDDYTKYRQEPAFNRDRRLFGALRWDPKLFGKDSTAHTTFRANYERGKINANRPRILPPTDRITPFFDQDKINKRLFDPYYAWAAGIVPYSSSALQPGETKNFWLVQYPGPGIQATNNPVLYYDNNSTPVTAREGGPYGYYGLNSTGGRDGQIGGFPFGSPVGIASYNEWAIDLARVNPNDPRVPAALNGFYKSKSLTDPSIFDFYRKLIDGPTKKEWQNWRAYNLAAEQTFFDGRLGFEFVYDRQKYGDGQERNLGGTTYISVDILQNTTQYPWAYPNLVVANPNAGRPFIGSGAKNGGNTSFTSDRENLRFIGYGELRARDFLGDTLLSRIVGTHRITGLYQKETYKTETRNWVRYAVAGDWSDAVGRGYVSGDGTGGLRGGDIVIDNVTYLSGPVTNYSSAAGLNLPRILNDQSPSGSLAMKYYDSTWKWSLNSSDPSYVNPGAAWTNPSALPGQNAVSTQSENPANYVGWKTGTFTILNADKGDIDRLYTDATQVKRKTTSKGATWQAYLWDDTIVATVGVRRDEVKQRSGSAPIDNTGLASMNYGVNPLDPIAGVSSGTSTTWGVVVHTPRALRDKLPWGSDISLSYSNGNNTRVETRYGFDGARLPNAKGNTKDYSAVVSTLNGRLSFKATYYKTTVANANLTTVTSEASTLGANTYYLTRLEAWGTASALMDLAGMAGQFPGWEWYWNWAEVDSGFSGQYLNPNSAAFLNSPSTAKEKTAIQSWLSQMLPQSWFDAYGFPVNVEKVKAGNWASAISNAAWQPSSGVGSVQPAGGGRINGAWPTGTVNNESKGWEFEIIGQPLKNWNLSFNASKQTASQTALGANLVNFIEASYQKYQSPAGDLRLWWGGDQTVRAYYTQNIWSAYQFQLASNGRFVPEMAPWRFNLVTTYNFDRGLLKGAYIGGGYRWQDGVIIGYGLNAKKDNLDINKPYWGPRYDWVDLWAGYERKLSSKINWRLQLNVRNVGKSPYLQPISVQPDGSPGQYRIQEGQVWTVSNTFTF